MDYMFEIWNPFLGLVFSTMFGYLFAEDMVRSRKQRRHFMFVFNCVMVALAFYGLLLSVYELMTT